jgi:hypothetical protein
VTHGCTRRINLILEIFTTYKIIATHVLGMTGASHEVSWVISSISHFMALRSKYELLSLVFLFIYLQFIFLLQSKVTCFTTEQNSR